MEVQRTYSFRMIPRKDSVIRNGHAMKLYSVNIPKYLIRFITQFKVEPAEFSVIATNN